MDPLLHLFHRQYLQQVINLRYPPAKLLSHADIQRQIYRHFFDATANEFLPPEQYQRKVLKRLLADIVREAKGEDDEILDELMVHMGHLSSLPTKSEPEVARTLRVLTYSLPDRPSTEITTSTFEDKVKNADEAQTVLIRESPQLLAAGSNVGLRTWEACLRLAYYLCTSAVRSTVQGANVFELGAGTGLLSLICAMYLGAGHVVATDGLDHVVTGIEENIALNRGCLGETRVVARLLDWTEVGDLNDALSVDGEQDISYDYILGADITYHTELHRPLALLLSNLVDRFPSTKVLIAFTVRKEKTLAEWRETCKNYGLAIREINEAEDHWQCPPYLLQTGLFHEQVFPVVIMDITRIC